MKDFIYKMTGTDHVTSLQQGIITGLLLAGYFVGYLLASPSADYLPRKRTIFIASIVFIIGAAIQTVTMVMP